MPCSAARLWLGEQPTKGEHSAVPVCSGPKHRRPTKKTGGRERRHRRKRMETKKSKRGCYCIEETDGGDVLLLLEE